METMAIPEANILKDENGVLMLYNKSELITDSMSMMMREDDADILERGVEHSSQPATPHTGPTSDCILSPPSIDLDGSFSEVIEPACAEETCVVQEKFAYVPNCILNDAASIRQFISPNKHPSIEELSHISERIEAGRLNHHAHTEDNVVDNDRVCTTRSEELNLEAPTAESTSCNSEALRDEVSSSPVLLSDQISESKSYHRRLHETAQFAEAVGEPQDGMIQVIIDDDDDDESDDESDDDDDSPDEEVDVENGNQDETIKAPSPLEKNTDDDPTSRQIDSNPSLSSKQSSSELELVDTHIPEAQGDYDDSFMRRNESFQFVSIEDCEEIEVNLEANNLSFLDREECRSPLHNDARFLKERSLSEGNVSKLDKVEIEEATPTARRRSASYQFFCHKLPLEGNESENNNDVFKGIISPEVTKRGISRGNYAQLHRKAWLEVSDKYHRYGKNLRTYYKHWEKLDHPTNMFFDWLDVKGEGEGWESPNLPECPRELLDSDRVLYITEPEEQARYLLKIVPLEKSGDDEHGMGGTRSKLIDVEGNPVRTGPSGWIFVLRDREIYGAEKRTRIRGDGNAPTNRFHHSSFFGGKAVAAAGILITDDNGCLTRLYPHSGHYRPGEAHMQRMLYHLYHHKVDLGSFLVDMQQIMHVSREVRDARTPQGGSDLVAGAGKKAKKTDFLCLEDAAFVALFLTHKAKYIDKGWFKMIEKIRPLRWAEPNSVRMILDSVDEGGVWKRRK